MKDRITLDFTGFDELERELKKMDEKTRSKTLANVTEKAARPIRDKAKSLVKKKTGNLKKSIQTKKLNRLGDGVGAAIVGPSRGKDKGNHGHLVEFGYKHTNGKTIPASPFMRPAFESEEEAVLKIYEEELKKELFD